MEFRIKVKALNPEVNLMALQREIGQELPELQVRIRKKAPSARVKMRRAEGFPVDPQILHLLFHVAHLAEPALIGLAVSETVSWLKRKFNVSAERIDPAKPASKAAGATQMVTRSKKTTAGKTKQTAASSRKRGKRA